MEQLNFVVGTKECPINKLSSIIRIEPVIREDWFTFAIELDIPKETINKLKQDVQLDKITHSYLIHELLEQWVSRNGSNAKLATLLNVVETACGANNIGEKIRLEFNLPFKGVNDNTDSVKWMDLSQAFKDKVKIILKRDFPELDVAEISPNLKGALLFNLMTGKTPKIFRPTVPKKLSYYVSRTLISRNIISKDIFDDHSQDVFLFTGMDRNELSRLAKARLTSSSREQLRGEVTSKFILLEQSNHYEKICARAKRPVHLLRKEGDGRLKWIKSSGGLENLQRHVDSSQNKLDEEAFCANLDDQTMTVCISDSPGMGKSVLLGEIGRRMSQLYPDRLVFFIGLGEFMKLIGRLKSVTDTPESTIVRALQSTLCENALEESLFQSKLKSEDDIILIELLLDGFDEVNSVEYGFALEILNTLKTSFKSTRVWVTSRLHLLEELEISLNILGYKIRAFNKNNQVNFLSSYWSRNCKSRLSPDRCTKFAEHCLQSLKSTMQSADRDIAGIPLQCLLIGEVFEDDALEYARLNNDFPPPLEIETGTIPELYQRLVKIKIEKYGSAYGHVELSEQQVMSIHVRLSLRLIFPDYAEQLAAVTGTVNPTSGEVEEVLKVGILESASTAESPRFMHRTFAEYFIAWFVNQKLGKWDEWTQELNEFFYSAVLECRSYIYDEDPDSFLNNRSAMSSQFNQAVVCYFLNWLLAATFPQNFPNSSSLLLDFRTSTGDACIVGDLLHLFKLLDAWIKTLGKDGIVIYRTDLVPLAIERSCLELIKLVLNSFEKHQEFDLDMQKKVLYKAARRGNYSIVEFLIKEKHLGRILDKKEDWDWIDWRTVLHSCVQNTKDASDVELESKKAVLKMLVEMDGSLLEEQDIRGNAPLLCDHVHVQLLIELIHLGANIFAVNDNDSTVLHWDWANEHLTSEEYHSLLISIPERTLKDLVQRDSTYREKGHLQTFPPHLGDGKPFLSQTTSQHYPVSDSYREILWSILINRDPLPKTLDAFGKAGVDFNLLCYDETSDGQNKASNSIGDEDSVENWEAVWKNYDADRDSVLAVAIKSGRNATTIRKMIQLGAEVNWKKARKVETLLHLAGRWCNPDAVKVLIDEYQIDVNVKDKDGLTPLDYAIESFFYASYYETCQALHSRGGRFTEPVNPDGQSWLHVAVSTCHLKTVKMLIQLGINVNAVDKQGNTPLHLCVISKPSLYVDYLERVDYFHMTQLLLENDADPSMANNDGETPFHAALKAIHIDLNTFGVLKSKSVVIWNPHLATTAVKFAIEKEEEFDDEQLNSHFQECAANGANFNWIDDKGNSLLHMAAKPWKERSIRFLVGKGADLNLKNNLGQTPLHVATIYETRRSSYHLDLIDGKYHQDFELFEYLIGQGADAKLKDKEEASLLHLAAAYGSEEILKFLLGLGILDVNGKDVEGNTALHYTLFEHEDWDNEDEEVYPTDVLEKCTLLIENGADVNILNNVGYSPKQIVIEVWESEDYDDIPRYDRDVVRLFENGYSY